MTTTEKISNEIRIVDLCENLWTNIVSFLTPLSSPVDPFSQSQSSQPASCNEQSILREERALRCTCKNLNQLLTSEEYFRIKVMETFGKGRDVSSWPCAEHVGGWKILHDSILSIYAPVEGFYMVCNAWPWGLFVHCHFENGAFCGDLIRMVPNNGTETDEAEYKSILDRIFEISFETHGKAKCEITLGNTSQEDQDQGCKVLAHAFGVSFQQETLSNRIGMNRVLPSKKDNFLFKINWNAPQSTQPSHKFEWPQIGMFPQEWDETQKGPPKAHELIEGIQNKWECGGSNEASDQFLLLEPLDSMFAADYFNTLTEAPQIKPGFYTGSYGTTYSCLRHEMLHVSCLFVDTHSPKSMEEAFGSRETPTNPFGTKDSSGVLLVGRKVTGDLHVPAGEITWFADITKLNSTTNSPTTVNDKDGNKHRVIKSWNGMGTLAFPGFNHPSWDSGWLLELEKGLFAFGWSRIYNQDVIILHKSPFQM